ncbi:hypothetical protein IMG5_038500 [Ichthyophthirius multifiliis]|uniref:Uncharacterized protein n=1 Tax=Ichthyophthirius multifiliis TaxID=5932 RepID=G0QLY0_ICHMU|nr:hypothetical protein IMG5_038500 [Ichthyophthirius multifiliis]EGR33775.1 hypothetical protein IMG5_038500 [Ichthyophthirius multifiliis]|eukprot:XP_004038999.1 hypothetical protein IMG5_038500 [Ichthyophthirius multifiliis]
MLFLIINQKVTKIIQKHLLLILENKIEIQMGQQMNKNLIIYVNLQMKILTKILFINIQINQIHIIINKQPFLNAFLYFHKYIFYQQFLLFYFSQIIQKEILQNNYQDESNQQQTILQYLQNK